MCVVTAILWGGIIGVLEAPEAFINFRAAYWCPMPVDSDAALPKCAPPFNPDNSLVARWLYIHENPFVNDQVKADQKKVNLVWESQNRGRLFQTLAILFMPPALLFSGLFGFLWVAREEESKCL